MKLGLSPKKRVVAKLVLTNATTLIYFGFLLYAQWFFIKTSRATNVLEYRCSALSFTNFYIAGQSRTYAL